jgi:hypothetical protein
MACTVEPGNAFDDNTGGPSAADLGSHLVEAIGDIGNFRLARGILDDGGAAGEGGRHDRSVGAADRHLRKTDGAAYEPLEGTGNDIAAIDLDLGAQIVQGHDQEVNRPGADRAAARHGYPRLAHARDQRRDDPETRPHPRYQLIGRGGVDDIGGGDVQRLPVARRFTRALAAHHDIDAVIAQDALQQPHIREPRHILQNERLIGQQARDHQRQGGVLGARDGYGAVEPLAPGDADAIHCPCPLLARPGQARRSQVQLHYCTGTWGTAQKARQDGAGRYPNRAL